jgi:hypothetical protein
VKEHHRRNTLLLGSVEVGWGIAMAFLQPESVLPVLVKRLGASLATTALVPAIYYASFPFEVWSPYATESLPRKRLLVWALHCAIPLVWAVTGAWLLSGHATPGLLSLGLFYTGFLISSGLTSFLIPLWYDYMGKITDPARRASAFSTIFALQSLAGFSAVAIAYAGAKPDPGDVTKFGVAFLVSAAVAMLANQAFLFTKEEPGAAPGPRPPLADYLRGFKKILAEDRTLRRYVLARGATRAST